MSQHNYYEPIYLYKMIFSCRRSRADLVVSITVLVLVLVLVVVLEPLPLFSELSPFRTFRLLIGSPFGAIYFTIQNTLAFSTPCLPLRGLTLWRTYHLGFFEHLGSLSFEVIGTFRLLGTLLIPYCWQLEQKGLQPCL